LFETELTDFRDIVAPPSIEVAQNYVHLEEKYSKTYFVFSYPRYLTMGWLAPIINMDIPLIYLLFSSYPHRADIKTTKKECYRSPIRNN